MRASLRVDPRAVKRFEDFGIRDAVVRSLPPHIRQPLPIQKKMLALNTSGLSAFARSVPNTGKTTAAILGLLSTAKQEVPHITNLVLVPSPALADRYVETMANFVGTRDRLFTALYRNGSHGIAADEAQHAALTRRDTPPHTLVATPKRILDYVSADPQLLPLSRLRQLVVDELDLFEHTDASKTTPLETLLAYLLSLNAKNGNHPLLTIMTSRIDPSPLNFAELPRILDTEASSRFIYDVRETPTHVWDGKMQIYDANEVAQTSSELGTINTAPHGNNHLRSTTLSAASPSGIEPELHTLAAIVRHLWSGEGLILVPASVSPPQLQNLLADLPGAVVARSSEIAGLPLDNLQNIYVLGSRQPAELEKLKWTLTGLQKKLTVVNF